MIIYFKGKIKMKKNLVELSCNELEKEMENLINTYNQCLNMLEGMQGWDNNYISLNRILDAIELVFNEIRRRRSSISIKL